MCGGLDIETTAILLEHQLNTEPYSQEINDYYKVTYKGFFDKRNQISKLAVKRRSVQSRPKSWNTEKTYETNAFSRLIRRRPKIWMTPSPAKNCRTEFWKLACTFPTLLFSLKKAVIWMKPFQKGPPRFIWWITRITCCPLKCVCNVLCFRVSLNFVL